MVVRGEQDKAKEEAKVKTEEDTTMTGPADKQKSVKAKKAKSKGKAPQTSSPQPPKAKPPKPKSTNSNPHPHSNPSSSSKSAATYLSKPNPKQPAESRFPDHDVSPEVAALLRAPAPDYTAEEEAQIIMGFITKVKNDNQAKELATALAARGEMPAGSGGR